MILSVCLLGLFLALAFVFVAKTSLRACCEDSVSAVEVWKSLAFGILATRMNAPSVMDTVFAWYLELSVHLSVPGGLSVSNFDGGKLSAVFFRDGPSVWTSAECVHRGRCALL